MKVHRDREEVDVLDLYILTWQGQQRNKLFNLKQNSTTLTAMHAKKISYRNVNRHERSRKAETFPIKMEENDGMKNLKDDDGKMGDKTSIQTEHGS